MPITMKQAAGLCEVTLEGEITLPCIAELREKLLEALEGTDAISLDIAKVSSLDLSCLQVFCAMHKTSLEKKREITFSPSFPPVLGETLRRTGYSIDVGCHHKLSGICLLKGASNG
jgi:anti-anti-sigma regulatory factor